MIVDWLRNNLISTVTGAALGSAVISGSVVYFIQERQATPTHEGQRAEDVATIPMRFTVSYAGTWLPIVPRSQRDGPKHGSGRFFCDLSVRPDAICQSDPLADGWTSRIVIQRHAQDTTRAAIYVFSQEGRTGVTWKQLTQGMVVNGVTIKAEPVNPKT